MTEIDGGRYLIISHADCPDGFCAAWIARGYLLSKGYVVDVHFAHHDTKPPWDKIKDANVFVLDFSYKRPQMDKISYDARRLVVLDHHKTSQADLAGMAEAVFDMSRSGAGMTWDWFYPGQPRPLLVDYVEDRDLWAWRLPDSSAVNAFISTLEFDFDVWDQVSNNIGLGEILTAGRAILEKTKKYVAMMKEHAIRIDFEGYNVPCVTAAPMDISELVGELAEGEPFAMGWFQRGDGKFQYSLRSKGGVDVSEIAKKHGGGGHRASSGFQQDHPFHLDGLRDEVPWRDWLFIVAALVVWTLISVVLFS